jgi:hypothetical protein
VGVSPQGVLVVRRRIVLALVVAACVAGVIAYQVTRPSKAASSATVFVPSPRFYTEFSNSFRTSIADAYWLLTVQYYGEHVEADRRLDSLPAMLDLVTTLSPRFRRPYLFGAYALVDAKHARDGYDLLQRGFKANPGDWRFPENLGAFAYMFGQGKKKDLVAASWYSQAAKIPGRPWFIAWTAANMLRKGGATQKAIVLWGQIYASGDKYSRQKAVESLAKLLPADKTARAQALAPLRREMSATQFQDLAAQFLTGY